MKRSLILTILAAYSVFFFACEDDIIPIPLPPLPPNALTAGDSLPAAPEVAEIPAPPPAPASPPVHAPPPAPVSAPPPPPPPPVHVPAPPPAKAPEALFPKDNPFSYSNDTEQLKSGRYTIQVGVFSRESIARNLVKRIEESGISNAYYAKVYNPDPEKGMTSLYYRVRVGYFNDKASAEAFAKNRLQASFCYKKECWITYTRNDSVGSSITVIAPAKAQAKAQIKEDAKKAAKQAAREAAIETGKAAREAAAMEAPPPQRAVPPVSALASPKPSSEHLPPPPPKKVVKVPPPPPPKKNSDRQVEIDKHGKVKILNN